MFPYASPTGAGHCRRGAVYAQPVPRMSDLVIALAGGAVGSLFTASASMARRFASVPSDVARNDFDAAERNDDLETWVADSHRELLADLQDRAGQAIRAGVQRGGTIPAATVKVKAIWLHRYRDQERQARRDLFAIRCREDWTHRAYRRLRRRPAPSLTATKRVAPVPDEWRRGPTHATDEVRVPDATRRTIDDTLRELAHRDGPVASSS